MAFGMRDDQVSFLVYQSIPNLLEEMDKFKDRFKFDENSVHSKFTQLRQQVDPNYGCEELFNMPANDEEFLEELSKLEEGGYVLQISYNDIYTPDKRHFYLDKEEELVEVELKDILPSVLEDPRTKRYRMVVQACVSNLHQLVVDAKKSGSFYYDNPWNDPYKKGPAKYFTIKNNINFRKAINYEESGFDGLIIRFNYCMELTDLTIFTPDKINFYKWDSKDNLTPVDIFDYYPIKK